MVHRAQDTRLLIALVKAEKDYSTCLTALLTASQASFAALTAYGASCPPGQAQAVINVIGALSGAEDALRKYAGVVDGWRGDLKLVKKTEEEVASIFRDREILIGRLVKASSKRTSRDSVLGVSLSSSSTTVQEPNSSTATPGNAPAPAAAAVGGNVKLSHAQAELQACEAHLALKEHDLERVRVRAVIGGLRRRCKALVECGWIWGEKGKEALHALEMSSLNANLNEDDKAPNGLGSDSSADLPNRPVFEEPAGSFSIDIPAAHSIDDHGAVHDNIPSSRLVVGDVRQKAESSDSEGGEVEVHKNKPFAHTPRDASRVVSEKRYMHTRHPSTGTTAKPASVLRVPPPHQSNIRLHKPKPVSDIGPSSTFKPGEAVGMPYSRTATSSGSLLGTITGLFKGKRPSAEYNAVYTGPTAVSFANGWSTRTDRNLVRSRVQLSSSEEDLPSSVRRRSRTSGEEEELTPKPTHMERSSDKGKGRAAPMSIPSSTSATVYTSKMSLERSSSSTRSRETAANTALNARTNGAGVSHNEVHASVGRSESKRSATSSGTASRRRRELQPSSSLNMDEVTRQRGGSRSNGGGSGGGGGLVLPPARLEVVRAPPSVTQAPVLTSPSPSPLVLPSTRKATSGPGSRGAPSPPPRHGTRDSGVSYLPAPTSPRRGAPFTKTANGGSPRPLKPALRVPSLSPSPSPAPAVHGSVGSSTPSSIRTPTMPTGTVRLPEIHAPIPRPPPPTSMPLGVLPLKVPLSDISESNRMSVLSEDYETCVEDFVDAEEGTEFDTPPAAPTLPLPAFEKPAQSQSPPNGEPQKWLSPQRTPANGSPVDASVSSTSTAQRKSVRMIIHPTVTVSAPEEYTDPPTPPAYDKGKEYEWYKSHSRSTSGSGTSQRSEVSRSAVPSAWETRVEHQRSVWENSEPEDEGYRAAKSALQRASAP